MTIRKEGVAATCMHGCAPNRMNHQYRLYNCTNAQLRSMLCTAFLMSHIQNRRTTIVATLSPCLLPSPCPCSPQDLAEMEQRSVNSSQMAFAITALQAHAMQCISEPDKIMSEQCHPLQESHSCLERCAASAASGATCSLQDARDCKKHAPNASMQAESCSRLAGRRLQLSWRQRLSVPRLRGHGVCE